MRCVIFFVVPEAEGWTVIDRDRRHLFPCENSAIRAAKDAAHFALAEGAATEVRVQDAAGQWRVAASFSAG